MDIKSEALIPILEALPRVVENGWQHKTACYTLDVSPITWFSAHFLCLKKKTSEKGYGASKRKTAPKEISLTVQVLGAGTEHPSRYVQPAALFVEPTRVASSRGLKKIRLVSTAVAHRHSTPPKR